MSPELAAALEALQGKAIVTESREYARVWAQRTRVRRWTLALLPVLAAAGVLWLRMPAVPSGLRTTEFVTEVGTTRTVTLAEGSRIVLDARSRLRVQLGAHSRDIELIEGQAQFEVAHDRQRPFRVRAAGCEIVALGTRFNVSRLPARITVTLMEGSVSVRALGAGASFAQMLSPGQQLQVTGTGELLDRKPVELESVTAWQRGRIVLDDLPLGDALALLNRYSTTQIVIHGTLLQSRRISGTFRAGDVETESLVLQRYFDLKEASRSGGRIVLEQN